MTKVMSNRGWVYVVIVPDWYTKKIVGHYSGKQARTKEWLEVLYEAGFFVKILSVHSAFPFFNFICT